MGAVFQYVSLYQHVRVLRSQCDEEIQRGNSDVQVLTRSLKTRAQDYLKSFRKLRDEFDTKDKDSYEKIRDLERLLAKERAQVSKHKVNSLMATEKLQKSESSLQALQSEKDLIEGQLIQLRNEVSSLKGKLSEERSAVKTKEEQINQLTSDLSAEKSLIKFKEQQ